MAGKQFLKKHENCILSLAMALILAGILAARFDFYYDLNDDVLIKDILSGVYTGTPDGHTMQLLYPLGALLALLYRGLSIPVFGAFLLFCQFGSIWAVGYRSTVLVDEERAARDGASFAPGMCSAASAARLAEPAVCSAWNITAERLGVKGVLLLAEALFWFVTSCICSTRSRQGCWRARRFFGLLRRRAKNASGRFCFIGFLSACVRRWRFCACRLQELVVFASGAGKNRFFPKKACGIILDCLQRW